MQEEIQLRTLAEEKIEEQAKIINNYQNIEKALEMQKKKLARNHSNDEGLASLLTAKYS